MRNKTATSRKLKLTTATFYKTALISDSCDLKAATPNCVESWAFLNERHSRLKGDRKKTLHLETQPAFKKAQQLHKPLKTSWDLYELMSAEGK